MHVGSCAPRPRCGSWSKAPVRLPHNCIGAPGHDVGRRTSSGVFACVVTHTCLGSGHRHEGGLSPRCCSLSALLLLQRVGPMAGRMASHGWSPGAVRIVSAALAVAVVRRGGGTRAGPEAARGPVRQGLNLQCDFEGASANRWRLTVGHIRKSNNTHVFLKQTLDRHLLMTSETTEPSGSSWWSRDLVRLASDNDAAGCGRSQDRVASYTDAFTDRLPSGGSLMVDSGRMCLASAVALPGWRRARGARGRMRPGDARWRAMRVRCRAESGQRE